MFSNKFFAALAGFCAAMAAYGPGVAQGQTFSMPSPGFVIQSEQLQQGDQQYRDVARVTAAEGDLISVRAETMMSGRTVGTMEWTSRYLVQETQTKGDETTTCQITSGLAGLNTLAVGAKIDYGRSCTVRTRGIVGYTDTQKVTRTILRSEPIRVPAGTFDAIVIQDEAEIESVSGGQKQAARIAFDQYWYVPSISYYVARLQFTGWKGDQIKPIRTEAIQIGAAPAVVAAIPPPSLGANQVDESAAGTRPAEGSPGFDPSQATACPSTFNARTDAAAELSCYCSPDAMVGTVYGTDVYTDDSSVCAAARHAGTAPEAGGAVRLRAAPGRSRYPATTRNGISTTSWARWDRSFVFTSPVVVAPSSVTATPSPDDPLVGDYAVDGTNPNGRTYRGSVTISGGSGGAYYFRWAIGTQTFNGTGRLRGKVLTVNWGQPSPVIYRVDDDGTLRGTWSNGRGREDLTPDR